MHSDGRVFKNPSKSFHILSFWVLLLLSLWAFWAHPLYWEVNKDQRLQVKSENRTDICGTDKYQQFYHVFLRILTKKNRDSEGKTSQSWLFSFNLGRFWRILVKLQFWSFRVEKLAKKLWPRKIPVNLTWIWHEIFRKLWWRKILVNLTWIWREMFRKLWSRKILVNLTWNVQKALITKNSRQFDGVP